MSKGFITIAQGESYIRFAYALALSIQNTQSEVNNLSIIVNDVSDVPIKYRDAFDNIIVLDQDDAMEKEWKIHNKWQYYDLSPYNETIILDADMIFTTDVSHYWSAFSGDLGWVNKVATFRGERVVDTRYYREAFSQNNLPQVYTAFFYFKKSDKSKKFFQLCKYIYDNWNAVTLNLVRKSRPKLVSGDVVFSLAVLIDGIENANTLPEHVTFVHMKSKLQGVRNLDENWNNSIPTVFTDDGGLYVFNYRQTLPFHYHIKEWLTEDIIAQLENYNV